MASVAITAPRASVALTESRDMTNLQKRDGTTAQKSARASAPFPWARSGDFAQNGDFSFA
jgi:hypothetical protein